MRDEIRKLIGFWLAQDLAGFRVDAVPFLLEVDGSTDPMHLDPHEYLRDLRAFLSRRSGEAVLLGEVNLPADDQRRYFGDEDGDELHLLFDFLLMQATHLALARRDAEPIRKALRARRSIPSEGAWATFLRNHDELTLDKLRPGERDEVFAAFGPEPDMQLYGRGLRRRLPPMLDGDQRRIRLAYGLMFALPGTPTIFYGEEIGMGENLAIDERLAVRTPMQWTAGATAGFSTAPPDALCRPLPTDPRFAPEAVNVQAQRTDPESLLNWFERTIRLRKELPEIGWGECRSPRRRRRRVAGSSTRVAGPRAGDGAQPGGPRRHRQDRRRRRRGRVPAQRPPPTRHSTCANEAVSSPSPCRAYDQRWFRVRSPTRGANRAPE